jgi:hypothetical protein
MDLEQANHQENWKAQLCKIMRGFITLSSFSMLEENQLVFHDGAVALHINNCNATPLFYLRLICYSLKEFILFVAPEKRVH